MKCNVCGSYFSSNGYKGFEAVPICAACINEMVLQQQYANIDGDGNVINQNIHFGPSYTENCNFCSEAAVTYCYDCRKPLCSFHKNSILGIDRCSTHNTLFLGKRTAQGVGGVVKGTLNTMSWLGRLMG